MNTYCFTHEYGDFIVLVYDIVLYYISLEFQ